MTLSLQLFTERLPTSLTSVEAFQRLSTRPYAIFLDSSDHTTESGSISILASDPMAVCNDWETLQAQSRRSVETSLPFVGGWMGYLTYEAYQEFIPQVASRESKQDRLSFGFYDTFLCFDHAAECGWIASLGLNTPDGDSDEQRARNKIDQLKQYLENGDPGQGAASGAPTGQLKSTISRDVYDSHLATIQEYIRAGDCYQINYTQCFEVQSSLDPATLYQRLRDRSPAPYAAYLNWDTFQILSASPEAFLELKGSRVTTRPIKGTRPRASDPVADARNRDALLNSAKDHAELLMITDLERNDLGRVCQPGSVKTVKLRELQALPQVYHLFSEIEGELRSEIGPWQVVAACFPGGSITGAPKIRAMQIIRELEGHTRGVYTGAIGFIGVDGSCRLNIPIRTLVYEAGQVKIYAGGGIVADSDAEAEYEECWVKTKGIREALES